MIARVRTITLAPMGLERTIEILRGDLLVALRSAPGFEGMIVLASTAESQSSVRVEVVSLWRDQHALDAFDSIDEHASIRSTIGQLAESTEVRDYEVSLSAGMTGGTVARFISVDLVPGLIDTVVTLFENVVMHAATEQHGFRRGLLLVDRSGHRAVSIGLWQSEADLLASEQVGYLSHQIGNFTPIVTSPIVPEMLAVVVEG